MGEIHVSDLERIEGSEIEEVKIWSDYGIDEEVIIELKDGSTRTFSLN